MVFPCLLSVSKIDKISFVESESISLHDLGIFRACAQNSFHSKRHAKRGLANAESCLIGKFKRESSRIKWLSFWESSEIVVFLPFSSDNSVWAY